MMKNTLPIPAAAHARNALRLPQQAFLAALLLALLCLLPGLSSAQEATTATTSAQTVNINTDDASSMASGLTGVGLTRADDIVRYREQFGPFTTVEQLAEVKGIGKATLEKNRARITLD